MLVEIGTVKPVKAYWKWLVHANPYGILDNWYVEE
jgi:hypothetical protein